MILKNSFMMCDGARSYRHSKHALRKKQEGRETRETVATETIRFTANSKMFR